MKKQYINPEMEVIEVKSPQILAGSGPDLSGEYGGGTPESRFFDDFERLNDSK